MNDNFQNYRYIFQTFHIKHKQETNFGLIWLFVTLKHTNKLVCKCDICQHYFKLHQISIRLTYDFEKIGVGMKTFVKSRKISLIS